MLGIAAAQGVGVVVTALLIASLGAGICFAPALTMLTETTESGPPAGGLRGRALEHGLGVRPGVGGIAGGAVAGLAGYAAPSIAVAAVLLLTAVYALRTSCPARHRRRRV